MQKSSGFIFSIFRPKLSQTDQHYKSRMSTVMGLNSEMVIYGNNRSLSLMTQARGQQKPALVGAIPREIESLPPCSWAPQLYENKSQYTHWRSLCCLLP